VIGKEAESASVRTKGSISAVTAKFVICMLLLCEDVRRGYIAKARFLCSFTIPAKLDQQHQKEATQYDLLDSYDVQYRVTQFQKNKRVRSSDDWMTR
jgi:hypothetical protein